MSRVGVIYKVTNKVSGKVYIGSTGRNVKKRWREHVSAALNPATIFHKAIKSYGASSFGVEEVASILNSEDNIQLVEGDLINSYDSLYPRGYNQLPESPRAKFEHKQKSMNKLNKPIVSVNINSGEVKRYKRVHDARRSTKVAVSSIYFCLNKTSKTGQGYCWFRDTGETDEYYSNEALKLVGAFKTDWARSVEGVSVDTGEVKTYKNLKETKRDGFGPKYVYRAIKSPSKIHHGYIWSFE